VGVGAGVDRDGVTAPGGADMVRHHRPHGTLGGQTPYERLRQKTAGTTPSKRSTSAAHSHHGDSHHGPVLRQQIRDTCPPTDVRQARSLLSMWGQRTDLPIPRF
jgi:hypothetical protein